MQTSRIPGFYKQTVKKRRELLKDVEAFTEETFDIISSKEPLPLDTADKMIENVIGTFPLPLGAGLNFLINGKEYVVPMVIEEPSVVASASHIAKIVRQAGGFTTEATERVMIGQIQVVGCADFQEAKATLLEAQAALIEQANASYPSIVKRGGGAKEIDVRILNEAAGSSYQQMLILHLYINTCDAMGANIINTMVESLAPTVEELTGGKVYLRILSNLADRCLARATCTIPSHLLETGDFSGEEVRDGVIHAYEFAASDAYRAVTHNKGIMNGIDPIVIATGNDWRAVEAGAHAYAARDGQYTSMTTWSVDAEGNLVGELELPMSVGIVGGSINVHPMAKAALSLLNVASAQELAQVIVAVGLAQNLGALKALATDGIQKGHMALHSRSVAIAAGATGELIDIVSKKLVEINEIRVGKAKELVEEYTK
ncbi:3-hydroxy-3-methylglutaryl coenzyme A reductase [Virgibacillus pantothenticus]|uniref:3-hydroxy-3-methylglutaryl coenzyme A reductase n=1 Tax=Virgibacillus pantothenticus TaxID=1473 RepID=A0A0L0QVI8_VIRPA|nr:MULTISPECIES: hydroxymethylglutaryl-CoA reductase, degradative [Virgibacillus]API92490.1 hydroxymethylglutaryl-CoA reductase, degradative [Virgibacillus sp. 6R]KNE22238.1 3-hydroxy-3-methylglutaryl-CoA reductase [Virgibacillus pantothenticus]MBS7427959.1 hydroxymethylglutaryl-CoA reductase, degradative [Virgibacillus sp. 19R1-5]MBU8568214.1 hydroxymethylglutaryl-CoA reductase, degradative [Virgibacillus pantothenticus]MBU8601860.1 hydroxymethylglutaryl-CoA reductase, degradative [Virgibacil